MKNPNQPQKSYHYETVNQTAEPVTLGAILDCVNETARRGQPFAILRNIDCVVVIAGGRGFATFNP